MGRGFTYTELLSSVVSASGGYIKSFYLALGEMEVEDIIEAIEVVAALQEDDTDKQLWEGTFNS